MSFGLYAIGFAIMIGGLIYGAHPHAYAYALDCRGRNRTPGYWDSVRGKSDASKRLCGITFPACNCPKVNHSGFLGPTCGKLEYDETHI
jgi:hypothetical protein